MTIIAVVKIRPLNHQNREEQSGDGDVTWLRFCV